MADPRGAYNKAWRKAHPELVRAQNRRSYLKRREQNLAYSRKYHEEHRDKTLAAMKRWAANNVEHRKEYQKKWYEQNRDKQISYHRERSKNVRMEVFKHYGEFCACCGEQDWEFLTIDHIEGGGTKHREELQLIGTTFYFWLKRNGFPDGYRTLCYNCNCSLGRRGYCPHRIGKDKFKYEIKVERLAALAKLQRK